MNARLLSACLVMALAAWSTEVLAQSAGKSAARPRRAHAATTTTDTSEAPGEKAEATDRATPGSSLADPKDPFDAAEQKLKDSAGKDGGSGRPKLEKATFGAGCFWHVEAKFEWLPGVKSAVSGYCGGNVANPSYDLVHLGETGHAEVVQVEYDPSVISYEQLLKVFWHGHDPTQWNRQGPDVGTQYRSVIFYHNEAQRKAALKSYKELTASGRYRAPIVTQLMPMKKFYRAEDYHQNYYGGKPDAPVARRTRRSGRTASRKGAAVTSKSRSAAAGKTAGATARPPGAPSTAAGAAESKPAAAATAAAAGPDAEP